MLSFFKIQPQYGLIPNYPIEDIIINGLNNSNYKRAIEKSRLNIKEWVLKNVKNIPQEVSLALYFDEFNMYYLLYDCDASVFEIPIEELNQAVDDDFILKNVFRSTFPNVLSEFCKYKASFARCAVYSLNQYFKTEDINELNYSLCNKRELNDLINILIRTKKNIIRTRGMIINKDSMKRKSKGIQETSSFHYLKSVNFQFSKPKPLVPVLKSLSAIDILRSKTILIITLDKKLKDKYTNSKRLEEINKRISKTYTQIVFIHSSKNSFHRLNFFKHFLYLNLTYMEGYVHDLFKYINFKGVAQVVHKHT